MYKTFLTLLAAFLQSLIFSLPAQAGSNLLCSTFPIYMFTKNISQGRDAFNVDLMLAGAGGCPHDYSPTPAELEKLSQANVLVINGRGLESFLSRALKVAKTDLRIVDASGSTPDAPLVLARDELMGREDLERHGNGPNPHLFAAPGSAIGQVTRITEALSALDPGGAELYRANAARLTDDFKNIAAKMAEAGEALGHPNVIVSHGIFEFLARDMGLSVVAAIEEEDGLDPSPEQMSRVLTIAKDVGARAILVDPHGNVNLARALGAETKIPVAVIDPVDSGPINAPLEYYQGVMLTDLDVLQKLLAEPEKKDEKKKKSKK